MSDENQKDEPVSKRRIDKSNPMLVGKGTRLDELPDTTKIIEQKERIEALEKQLDKARDQLERMTDQNMDIIDSLADVVQKNNELNEMNSNLIDEVIKLTEKLEKMEQDDGMNDLIEQLKEQERNKSWPNTPPCNPFNDPSNPWNNNKNDLYGPLTPNDPLKDLFKDPFKVGTPPTKYDITSSSTEIPAVIKENDASEKTLTASDALEHLFSNKKEDLPF